MAISCSLAQAQARLLQLRSQIEGRGQALQARQIGLGVTQEDRSLVNAQRLLEEYRQRDGVDYRPRVPNPAPSFLRDIFAAGISVNHGSDKARDDDACAGKDVTRKNYIKHHPSLGSAVHRAGRVAEYRVWLICRLLDRRGAGWVSMSELKKRWVQTRRRLYQILNEGEGWFWEWNKGQDRIWLFGAARVAARLRVNRLIGKPVAISQEILFGGIGEFKAHLYAAWHSGRVQAPVSRAAQREATGVAERTQRHYCQVAGVDRQPVIVVGQRYSCATVQKVAWKHGNAVFRFVDHAGRQGEVGREYIAYQMPSIHQGPHQQIAKGRQHKINRKLKDLVNSGAQGNNSSSLDRMYHADGETAVRAYSRDSRVDAYWPQMAKVATIRGKAQLWNVIPAAMAV